MCSAAQSVHDAKCVHNALIKYGDTRWRVRDLRTRSLRANQSSWFVRTVATSEF